MSLIKIEISSDANWLGDGVREIKSAISELVPSLAIPAASNADANGEEAVATARSEPQGTGQPFPGGDNGTGDESPAVTITRNQLVKALLEAHAEAAINMTKMIIFGQKPSEQAVMASIERIMDKYCAN